ncbi:MAG TPA: hypothetical protein VGA13_04390 [Acidimicrobiales bacterium]
MRLGTVGAGAAAVVAMIIGASMPVQAVLEADDERVVAIEALLDRREEAVRQGDLDGWMATVDPQAASEFQAAQRRAFRGWSTVPLASYTLEVVPEDVGDLAVGLGDRLTARYGTSDVFLPETVRRYRLAGYDDRDMFEFLFLTYVERDGTWYVAGDDDVRSLGLDTAKALWELTDVRVLPSEHYLVISPVGLAARADQITRIAEAAFDRFDSLWDRSWSGRLPLILPGSVAELERILQSTFDLTSFVAFVAYDADRDDGDFATSAPRIYIQDQNLSRHPEAFQLETLVHELVHAASAEMAGPFSEAWVQEGLAEWITDGRPDGRPSPPAGSDGVMPDNFEFTTGAQGSILAAYGESKAAFAAIARAAGGPAPVDFFAAVGSRRAHPGTSDYNTGAALASVTGLTLDDLRNALVR